MSQTFPRDLNRCVRRVADRLRRVGLLACALALSACATTSHGPYATPTADSRNPLKAQELTMKAADLIDKDPPKAEQLLREALSADLYHGPAHNDLGVIEL